MLARPALRVQSSASIYLQSNCTRRLFSESSQVASTGQDVPVSATKPIDSRWLTMTKRRIGKCMMFGMKPAQIDEGGKILRQLAEEWRELIAGSEGFLTDKKRRSLYRHNVVWGEQDIMIYGSKLTKILGPRQQRYLRSIRRDISGKLDAQYWNSRRYREQKRMDQHGWIHGNRAHFEEYQSGLQICIIPFGSEPPITGTATQSTCLLTAAQPMESPDKITVYHKLVPDLSGHLSSQSAFQLEVMILSEARQRPAARCFEDIVLYDYTNNRKAAKFPPFVMEQFKIIWKQQEQEKKNWTQRIADIENRVRNLELESWDAVDAVEDHGSAT